MYYLLSSFAFLFPGVACAQDTPEFFNNSYLDPIRISLCKYLPYCSGDTSGASEGISILANIVGNAVLVIIGPAAVVIILYAAIRMVSSAGNDETAKKAYKEIILYALLGLLFAVFASTILVYVVNFVTGVAS